MERLSNGGSVEVTFSFPATDEGRAALRALEHALDEGTSTTMDGKYLASGGYPLSHRRRRGRIPLPTLIEVHASKPSEHRISMRLEVSSQNGTVALPYIEFRIVRSDSTRVTLVNDHQAIPLEVTLDLHIREKNGLVRLRKVRIGRTPADEKEMVAVLLWTMRSSSRIRLIDIERNVIVHESDLSSVERDTSLPDLVRYHEILEKLCFIEARARRFGAMGLDRELNEDDAALIEELFMIVRDGQVEKTTTLDFMVKPDSQIPEHAGAEIKLHFDMEPVDLCGTRNRFG
ncbi:MAG: hypothetical protein IPM54_37395 [Polyangiaceae bacterium]|nr:hypothetical protein [Polyangiaceae bacterium]